MERPHAIPNTRQVHWTATPSEEQLLGSPRLATASPGPDRARRSRSGRVVAVRGAEGVPFRSIEAATPTTADGVTARALDRQELSSLPR
jgi:hypothetical protein